MLVISYISNPSFQVILLISWRAYCPVSGKENYRRRPLIIWYRATSHRSKEVKKFLKEKAKGRIHLEMLPPYCPELNVDEQVHAYIKQNIVANQLFKTLSQLQLAVHQGYLWLKGETELLNSFFYNKETAFYQT